MSKQELCQKKIRYYIIKPLWVKTSNSHHRKTTGWKIFSIYYLISSSVRIKINHIFIKTMQKKGMEVERLNMVNPNSIQAFKIQLKGTLHFRYNPV